MWLCGTVFKSFLDATIFPEVLIYLFQNIISLIDVLLKKVTAFNYC